MHVLPPWCVNLTYPRLAKLHPTCSSFYRVNWFIRLMKTKSWSVEQLFFWVAPLPQIINTVEVFLKFIFTLIVYIRNNVCQPLDKLTFKGNVLWHRWYPLEMKYKNCRTEIFSGRIELCHKCFTVSLQCTVFSTFLRNWIFTCSQMVTFSTYIIIVIM